MSAEFEGVTGDMSAIFGIIRWAGTEYYRLYLHSMHVPTEVRTKMLEHLKHNQNTSFNCCPTSNLCFTFIGQLIFDDFRHLAMCSISHSLVDLLAGEFDEHTFERGLVEAVVHDANFVLVGLKQGEHAAEKLLRPDDAV